MTAHSAIRLWFAWLRLPRYPVLNGDVNGDKPTFCEYRRFHHFTSPDSGTGGWTPAIIAFKSTPSLWSKERYGKKPNTVRFMDALPQAVIEALEAGLETRIRISNSITGMSFERVLTDVTSGGELLGKHLVIFSWVHDTDALCAVPEEATP